MGNRRKAITALLCALGLFFVAPMLALLAASCQGCTPAPHPVDPGTYDDCEAACARLVELQCPEAAPTPDGASCVEVCGNVEGSGYATINPRCVAQINSCKELDACQENH